MESNALFCLTNITQCCRSKDIAANWYYPNSEIIGDRALNTIYKTRGPKSVILHRDNTLQPVGIFRCQINNNNVYLGIYQDNSGKTMFSNILRANKIYYKCITSICLVFPL